MASSTPACPHCRTPMTEVTARANTGYLILLDQCPTCGGIWCDRWELFPLSAEEALRIDRIDEKRLADLIPMPTSDGTCPRCALPLKPFRDPSLPADSRVERCRRCDGMWFNRGELGRTKSRVRARTRRVTDPHAFDGLVRACGASATWATVSDLDGAMRYNAASEDPEDSADPEKELWSAAGWLILRSILRLLLKV